MDEQGVVVAIDMDLQAEILAQKIRHYLITTMGRTAQDANEDEFYRGLTYALREETMIHWLATVQTIQQRDARMLYYLSMEYLPGRLLANNITNLQSLELVRLVLHKMNRSFAEIVSRETDPGLGNGGLGRLASCFLDSLATQNYPSRGYGLRYQYGTFEQQLWEGVQIEAPDTWLVSENPWEFRRDLRKVTVKFCGHLLPDKNLHGDEIFQSKECEEVSALPYDIPIIGYSKQHRFSVATLRLWTTKESPRNFQLQRYNAGRLDQAAENSALTDVLYPSDHHETGKRIRLKQEFLLVSASLQDIFRHYLENHENFRAFADKVRIQINDTHPALVIPELIRLLYSQYDLPWSRAIEIAREVTGYTNHTILAEALEQWDQNLLSYLLPQQYKIIEKLNLEFLTEARKRFPGDEPRIRRLSIIENGRVRMANLALFGAHRVNGVAALHTEILKEKVFRDFYEMYPNRFVNITNGVTPRRWLLHCNPDLAKFISKRIGEDWITDFTQIKKLAEYASDASSQQEFLDIKQKNKERLVDYLAQQNKSRDAQGNFVDELPLLDSNALFDVQVKRIHEYKRQLMNILHVLMLWDEIRSQPHTTRVARACIIGGKAAAGYETAKNIIRLIHCVARKVNLDPTLNGLLKVVFVENYNVSRAEAIMPATDLSEQISTAGMEASGTGNMKLTINGALTIGTDDGANIEMRQAVTDSWWPFLFGASSSELEQMRQAHTYNPWDVYTNNPAIGQALDHLKDGSLATNDGEHQALLSLFNDLLMGQYGQSPDRFFVLKDLEAYYSTQKSVELLFAQPDRWATYCIHNIAAMGTFSSDYTIKNYATKVWGLEPCPIDEQILARIAHEYSQHNSCRVLGL